MVCCARGLLLTSRTRMWVVGALALGDWWSAARMGGSCRGLFIFSSPGRFFFLREKKFRYSCGSSPSRFPPLTKRATDGPSVFSSLRTAPQESTVFLTGPRARNHFASFSLRRRRQPTWKWTSSAGKMPKDNTRTEISRHRLLLLRSDFFFFTDQKFLFSPGKVKKKTARAPARHWPLMGLFFFIILSWWSFSTVTLSRTMAKVHTTEEVLYSMDPA